MKTFHELYLDILKQEAKNGRYIIDDYNPRHLDCLLHPDKYAPVLYESNCTECDSDNQCIKSCLFNAIKRQNGVLTIDKDSCTGCGACMDACKMEKIVANKDVIPVIEALKGDQDVYALVAPAFIGQFNDNASPGKLRNILKKIGFKGMIEVAVFADILTMKEALEFDKNILQKSDYQLTSCCCPVWIAMIKNIFSELMPHVPGAVSPMIAAGRVIKKLYPNAKTVFIGPCMAKKKEASEPDIVGAIDYVLTFTELQDLFDVMEIKTENMEEDQQEHSSRAGRIYAHTGGVSEAVKETVKQLNAEREIKVIAEQADGVAACKSLIERLQKGEINANFYEGMACKGGCVGGPKRIISPEKAKELVDDYGNEAVYKTPLENPFVIELLTRLGYDSIEDFLEKDEMFNRKFN